MSRPAAFLGDYVDCRFLPGLKLARISIEIPIEEANAFLSAFGAPDKASPVKVGIARLNEGALTRLEYPPEAEPPTESPQSAGGKARAAALTPERRTEIAKAAADERWGNEPRVHTRSQVAFLKTGERAFQEWLGVPMNEDADVREAECDHRLKMKLCITSKSELDQEGPKALAFDRLLTDFSVRGIVR